jgi:hypothetical protein
MAATPGWTSLTQLSLAIAGLAFASAAVPAVAADVSTAPLPEIAARALDELKAVSARTPPALAFGLAAMVLVPALALGGVLFRLARRLGTGEEVALAATTTEAWPIEAWLELVTGAGGELRCYALDHPLTRIGREDDNEIRLDDATVHRYHAALARDSDTAIVITDLAGTPGNGVRVNGRRVERAELQSGDEIALGRAVMTFRTRPLDGTVIDEVEPETEQHPTDNQKA